MSRRMKEIPSMRHNGRRPGRFAGTGSMIAAQGLRTVLYSPMAIFMIRQVLSKKPGQSFQAVRSLKNLSKRLRKPERKQKKQGRDFHSRRNISWCVISTKQQERSLMSLKPGKSRSVQRREILLQLQQEEQ